MSVVGSQQQTFLRLLRALQPHWRRDPALPARIQALFSRHQEFGSRDRRLYRELIYTTLRYLPWIEPVLATEPARAVKLSAWLAASTRDTLAYREETAGDWPAATTLAERASFLGLPPAALLPAWFRPECAALFESPELDVQLERAAVWLRLQGGDAAVEAEFAARHWSWQAADILASAWRLLVDADVTKSDAYARGAIEVQDLGSQLLLEAVGLTPGERWLDACAGAGGKTLQLARGLGPAGRVDAFDVRAAALAELRTRVRRAGIRNVQTVASPPAGGYDGVLVDAPCSGSGTWRRAPHLKWTTAAAVIPGRASRQQALLDRYSNQVRPGGRLVYATCSLARTENEAVVDAFLSTHADFAAGSFARTFGFAPGAAGLTVMPSRHNTDGFFVATLLKA